MRRNKNAKYIFLVGLVCFISIGYAYLTANLNMTGTTTIANSRWDIHFDDTNVTNMSASVEPLNVSSNITTAKPIIKGTNNQELEYEVRLNQPGDVYEFTADIINNGEIDAELKSIETKIKINDNDEVLLTNNLPSYLDYSVTYSDNDSIDPGDRLDAGDTKTIKVHVGLKSSLTNDQYLQALGQTIRFKYTINYVQADVGA